VTRRDFTRRLAVLLLTAAGLFTKSFATTTAPAPAAPAPPKPVPPKPKLPPPPQSIEAHLAEHFSYLNVDKELLAHFARAYESQYGQINPRGPIAAALLHTRFLLSTDFFQNGSDEKKPLKFVALYDPYVTPCYNPLSSITKES
jgi:hypothetical protein